MTNAGRQQTAALGKPAIKAGSQIIIRLFRRGDQQVLRSLILAGLGEHFGFIDPTCNPDLDDIQKHYVDQGHVCLVVEADGEPVGTGTLLIEGTHSGRLVRMSVRRDSRRQGIGRMLVDYLLEIAQQRGLTHIEVETNKDWEDATRLYRRCGFKPYAEDEISVYMRMDLLPLVD